EKKDRKLARRIAKELRHEFLEDNDWEELDSSAWIESCSTNAIHDFDSETHDAWLMKCPKDTDFQKLVGKRIKLPGRRYIGDIKVRTTAYSAPLIEAVGYVNYKRKNTIRKVPLSGYVVVSKRRESAKRVTEQDSGSEFPIALPPPKYNLPVRHPFFGRDYKKHIELPGAIRKVLKKAAKKDERTTALLRRTANYYVIKSRMLKTTQTLEEKEHEVRQSVLTGIRPKFMSNTAAPSMF
ncbi:hypothetical protein KR038_007852, partial [Drosophila bunnanda]